MKNQIGIGRIKSSKWYEITFLFLNTIAIISLYSAITKTPTYSLYSGNEVVFNFTEKDINSAKWIFKFSV